MADLEVLCEACTGVGCNLCGGTGFVTPSVDESDPHGVRRVRERLGVPKRIVRKRVAMAYQHGVDRRCLTSHLRRWVDSKRHGHRTGRTYKIHDGYLWVFFHEQLVTVFAVPGNLGRAAIEQQAREARRRD